MFCSACPSIPQAVQPQYWTVELLPIRNLLYRSLIMLQTLVSPTARQQLTDKVIESKANKGLSWQDLTEGTGSQPGLSDCCAPWPTSYFQGGG